MKKRNLLFGVLIPLLVLFSSDVYAQIQRGNMLVGSDISNFDLGLNDNNPFTMTINPKVAVFFKNNFAIGGFLDFGLEAAEGTDPSISYGIGPLIRYYSNKRGGSMVGHSCFFLEGNVGIQGNNPAGGNNTNGLGLGGGPGISYFITPHIGLEGLLKYNGIIGFGEATTTSKLNLSVGLQVYLPTKYGRVIVK